MSTREPRPDVLIVGAPKAATSALHVALARHPQVYASPIKEPKYYLCGDAPPPAYSGPGDAHSQQEWIWRRTDYERLFTAAPADAVRLESTPFYLYVPDARRRLAEDLPEARFVAVIRDPVDRAYSNWMHLWVDGLEPEPDFCRAWRAEEERIAAGWAPFWHYQRQGRYGEQLADLIGRVGRDRVLVLRYREVVAEPVATLNRVCRFLDIALDQVAMIPADNSRPFVPVGVRSAVLGPLIRAGAAAAAYAPPAVWRKASRPLTFALQHRGHQQRPRLAPETRTELVRDCLADIALLEDVLSESFDDWRSSTGRGSFAERTSP
jgi:hypothetical protein